MHLQALVRSVVAVALLALPAAVHAQHTAPGGMPGQNGGSPTVSLGGLGDSSKPATIHDRRIRGTVSDADGKALPGAMVYIKNLNNNTTASAFVDDKGFFRFGALDKNADYRIWAKLDKKDGPAKTVSQYDTRDELSLNLKIE